MEITEPTQSFDRAAALERVGGDWDLLREIAQIFLAEYPALQMEIDAAVSEGHAARLMAAAHKLKGSLGTFSATPAFEAALRLEMLGRAGDVADAVPIVPDLAHLLSQLHTDLEEIASRAE